MLKEEAEKALTCLYLCVDKWIADNICIKVMAYINSLEHEITKQCQCTEQIGYKYCGNCGGLV
jgi:hypothetical protein